MDSERLAEVRAIIKGIKTNYVLDFETRSILGSYDDLLQSYDSKCKQLAKLQDLEGEVACATDLLNTWARESQVPECKDYFAKFGLRNVVDGLWSKASSTISTLRKENLEVA